MDPNILQKLKNYQGSLTSTKWAVPKTSRGFSHSCNRLLKLFYSMKNRKLFYPELVDNIKVLAEYYKVCIHAKYPDKRTLLPFLDEIIAFQPPLEFSRIEETREKEKTRCNICKVDLVYPAYLIYKGVDKHGEEFEEKSLPIGIHCLHSLHKKLNKYQESLKIEWEIGEAVNYVTKEGLAALGA